MKVIYLAHPCAAETPEEHEANLARALRWFRWAIDQDVAVIADWILYCRVWDDFDDMRRDKGLEHDDAMIALCDEFWMVGGRVSAGMYLGKGTAIAAGVRIVDHTGLGEEPPA